MAADGVSYAGRQAVLWRDLFSAEDGYGRPSFKRVLLSIANAYKEKNGDVVEQAKMVESAIAQSESFAGKRWAGFFRRYICDADVGVRHV